mmetsp:Transcript_6587/g.18912  ORF Transcript_6587/g.18912 Transcript_6587/m.18912 type:complete len:462 (+) Transcript_6587:148-1533(+)
MNSFRRASGKMIRILSFTVLVTMMFLLLEGEAAGGVNSKRNSDGIKFPRYEVYDLPAIQWACQPFLERHLNSMEAKQLGHHLNPMKEKTKDLCMKLRGGNNSNDNDVVLIEDSTTESAAEISNSSVDENSITMLESEENAGEEAEVDVVGSESSLPINGGHRSTSTPTLEDEGPNPADEAEQLCPSEQAKLAPSAAPSLADTDYKFSVFQKGDGHETDADGIPDRYLKMQGNRRDLAKAALENTVKWRKENDIDTILARPHSKFDISKAVFPHYFCGRDNTQHVILLQRPGLMNVKLAHKNGLTGEELLFHYIYVMEYLWRIVDPAPQATMTSIIDLTDMNISILRKREQLRIGSLFLSTMDAHFPQRSYKTFLINAPKWFGALYKLASPLLRESTKEKIMILTKGKEQDNILRDLLRDCPIPEGTKYEDVPAGIMEDELRNFCLARLEEAGETMLPVDPV